jgi:hypothetical protein
MASVSTEQAPAARLESRVFFTVCGADGGIHAHRQLARTVTTSIADGIAKSGGIFRPAPRAALADVVVRGYPREKARWGSGTAIFAADDVALRTTIRRAAPGTLLGLRRAEESRAHGACPCRGVVGKAAALAHEQ